MAKNEEKSKKLKLQVMTEKRSTTGTLRETTRSIIQIKVKKSQLEIISKTQFDE